MARTGEMAYHYVKGLQANNVSAMVKHYVGPARHQQLPVINAWLIRFYQNRLPLPRPNRVSTRGPYTEAAGSS